MVRKKRRQKRNTSSKAAALPRLKLPAIAWKDPATWYAKEVAAGRIVAGPYVRLACERHLRDLRLGYKRGLSWHPDRAEKALGYFRDVLRLNGGEFEGVPFELVGNGPGGPWQAFIVASIFGWYGAEGFRRFRTAYVEIGKGNGKSPLAGGVGLYGLTSDGEERAEIYAAAATKDQAMILFRDAVAMREQSPILSRVTIPYGGLHPWNLLYTKTHSFFRTIAQDTKQSGPRPHFSLCDELHEHPDGNVISMLHAGMKGRRNPLIFEITNSGVNKESICYQHHDYSIRVLEGKVEDDAWFAYVCALDRRDKWAVEGPHWLKVNPNLYVSIQPYYLREQVKKAQGMPAEESRVRRLNFCEWVGAVVPWIASEKWEACEADDLDLAAYRASRCWAGLDLSTRIDLTALDLAFLRPDGTGTDNFTFFWMPEDVLREREQQDKVPYSTWRDQGFLETTPGSSIDYRFLAVRIRQLAETYGLQAIAFDRYRIDDLKREFDDLGFPYTVVKLDVTDQVLRQARGLLLVEHGQGFKDMTPSIDGLTAKITNGTMRIRTNPVMRMCSANAVLQTGAAAEKKFHKQKARGRIDGIIALTQAERCVDVFGNRKTGGTIYDTEDLMVV